MGRKKKKDEEERAEGGGEQKGEGEEHYDGVHIGHRKEEEKK